MAPFPIPHIESCPRRTRAYASGVCLIDSTNTKLVWEQPYFPNYFFPEADLPRFYMQLVEETPHKAVYSLFVGGERHRALTQYLQGELAGLFTIEFASIDAWFEEDEEIFVHPKDPYKRIDILRSSKHVRVEVEGTEVANTRSPCLLYETGLPVRYYVPKLDCRLDLLVRSDTKSECPYKGEAFYYDICLAENRTFKDMAWWYKYTPMEAAAIHGLVAFYSEKLDIFVDGEKQERPVTHFK